MKLTFRDFYRIRKYTNENWKGGYSDEDVAEQAYDDITEYERLEVNPDLIEDFKWIYEGLMEDIYNGCNDESVIEFIDRFRDDLASCGIKVSSSYDNFKRCSHCGEGFLKGFFVKGFSSEVDEYFCCKECMNVYYTDEEIAKLACEYNA